MTVKAVWHIVKESAKSIGVVELAPHDLRRTCARLCHASGREGWPTIRKLSTEKCVHQELSHSGTAIAPFVF
jgi:integrase